MSEPTFKSLREVRIAIDGIRDQLKLITAALGVGLMIAGGLFYRIDTVARETNGKIESLARETDRKFDGVNKRFDETNKRFDETNRRIEAVAIGVARIEGHLEQMARRSERPSPRRADATPASPAAPPTPAIQDVPNE